MSPGPLLLLLFLPLLLAPGSAAVAPGVTARTLAPCYLADLRPAAGSLVSAVGCTVLLTAPTLRGSGAVAWEYRQGQEQGVILSYGHQHPPNVSQLYWNRATFNESTLALRVVLQHGDSRLYRLRGQDEATAWFHLRVLEPLSKPTIQGDSVVREGSNTKLVCSVLHGQPDAYWWKKNGELLLGSERIRFERNSTLCILLATISDSGYYTCVVSNAVSQNETSFLLKVHQALGCPLCRLWTRGAARGPHLCHRRCGRRCLFLVPEKEEIECPLLAELAQPCPSLLLETAGSASCPLPASPGLSSEVFQLPEPAHSFLESTGLDYFCIVLLSLLLGRGMQLLPPSLQGL